MPVLTLDQDQFLARHWQREPLLLRDAVAGFKPPISADELAGLAMEEDVESRIIECREPLWQLHHGPFTADAFDRSHPWTLLVQGVDRYVDAVAELLDLVDFIPRWRLDDIMVSYASAGGGVGPHYDLYDVFLLQGEGERVWRIGQRCDDNTPLLPHPDLKLLADFHCQAEYRLQCGDILYVPPGVAHWGVSVDDSTCFSIGFRAPKAADLLSRWVDSRLEQLDASVLLTDPDRNPVGEPGEIRRQDIQRAQAQLSALLTPEEDESWFGELVTESETAYAEITTVNAALAQLRGAHARVVLVPGARVAWQALENSIRVFANGSSQLFPPGLRTTVCLLCKQGWLDNDTLQGTTVDTGQLLRFLLEHGGIDVD
ncbi:cupin [Kineobactrum sediminis]|uniref:Cupin n=1 Tax=Kineobactrum sediminis TaxID=1905677 RepID=A0A2N5Y2L0_9GAMM|nr:cupin domain-containing protein [Kineobactrum sediminis]PLW82618.1 cupin [Kineobactrum sediminis]